MKLVKVFRPYEARLVACIEDTVIKTVLVNKILKLRTRLISVVCIDIAPKLRVIF